MRTIIMMIILCLASATVIVVTSPVKGVQPPRRATEDFVNQAYPQGTVTAVTKESITIETPEYHLPAQVMGPDGVARWVMKVSPALPPKRFAVSATLAAGGVPRQPRATDRPGPPYLITEPFMYRLTDVKVGDWVLIRYARLGGVDICDHIKIMKRPGGRIPPLPEGVVEKSFIPYHERMNAYWDLEDKGIPYPEKFGHMRRWPVAPSPREAPVRLVAPPPREATIPPIPRAM